MKPITRETPLAEVLPLLPNTQPLTVKEDLPLRSAVLMAGERQEIDTLAVVDDRDVLIGILPVDALVDYALADLWPEGYMPGVTGLSELMSSAPLFVHHRFVGEIMEEMCSVTREDIVAVAAFRMHARNLRGVPVVDDDGKVVQYLDLFDTLLAWMRSESDNEAEGS